MKFIVEHGRLELLSCSRNLTDIGEHTHAKVIFKPNSIMSVTFCILDESGSKEVTKVKQEWFNQLYRGEELIYAHLVEIGKRLITTDREVKMEVLGE